MKVEIEKTVPFFGVDQDLVLYPRRLLNYFQEAVGIHTRRAGDQTLDLMARGQAWMLSRIGLEIRRWPRLDDVLTIRTWHTRDKGFKAFRDFEVTCRGERLVAARTMWLFIDLTSKKILRIPQSTGAAYTCEPELDFDMDLDAWAPATRFQPDQTLTLAIRPSDFDPLGHVNNALYFEYLHGLVTTLLPEAGRPGRIRLQYVKEIPRGTATVQMGLCRQEDGYLFKIFSDGAIHAAGTLSLDPSQAPSQDRA